MGEPGAMPTYLLTGVAGFLGSHLAERLVAAGHRVRGVDCLRDYYSTAELAPLLDGCDGVFHLAAQAGVRSSWGQEFHCYTRDNVLATQRLFEACRGRRLEKVVYASSSSVYGDAQALPTAEDAELRPISPYGVSKLAVEHLARVYHDSFGVPAVGLRYFTVYGPRQRPDMAFHRFLRRALQDLAIPVYGQGQQTRDFTYVDDAVEATISAMVRGVPGRVYNIGPADSPRASRGPDRRRRAHLGPDHPGSAGPGLRSAVRDARGAGPHGGLVQPGLADAA